MSTLDNLGGSGDTTAIEDVPVVDTLDALIEPEEITEEPEILVDKTPKVEDDLAPESEIEEIESELDREDKKDKDPTTEELEELIQPVRRAEILAKYPKFFKEFPYMERAYYRNREFTEIFAVPKEAREAKVKADTLDNFERVLMTGETNEVLRAVKQTDEKAFAKIVDNYLYDLGKVDPVAANHVTGNVIKYTIQAMMNASARDGDETLEAAAKILNKFIFLTSEVQTPNKLVKEERANPELEKLNRERAQFAQERYNTTVGEVGTKIQNKYKALINANIDTKEIMSDYVRTNAERDVYEKLTEALQGDRQFQILKDRLWKRAADNGYSKDSLTSIEIAFISKAKTLLPTVIKEAKIRALKGMGKRVREEKEETSPTPRKQGQAARPQSSAKETNFGKKSTLELLQD